MRRVLVAALAFALLPAHSQDIYDLVLKGGQVIDPKNGRNARLDIAIAGGKISRIAPNISAVQARRVVSLHEYVVTPGLIDLNAHVFPRNDGVDPDHNTLRFGVTTVVDAGSSDAKTFEQFRREIVSKADVRVLAFVNASDGVAALIRKYPQVIVGIRSAEAADEALKVAESTKTLVMADAAAGSRLRAGDIQTRVYGPKASGDVRKKGVIADVGHGADGLLFRIAAPAIKQGFLPDTISTGLDAKSAVLPRPTMTSVMSRFLALGLTLEQVIERTTVNPARALKRTDIGSLEEGGVADIAAFELRKGRFGYLDGAPARLNADRELRCILTVRNGEVVWDTEGLSLTDWKEAGPYSNFK